MEISNLKKIYVRTLKSMTSRTDWITKELDRVGIENYEFYYNFDKYDDIIDEWREKGLIKLGPECFQCGKLKCYCRAKVLTRGMVANFISSLELFRKISENDDEDSSLYMIMEDDVLFQDNAAPALNYMLQDGFLQELPDQEILFKVGWGDMQDYRVTHFESPVGKHIWKKDSNKFANPCFIANKKFFTYMINNFERIETACDMWVHRIISEKILNFEIYPALCKELSHIGEIESAMHKKYSEATKMQAMYHTTRDEKYVDLFIKAEKEYFDYWFSYAEKEWGIKF